MLTVEAEKKVKELAKEAAERAILDYSVSQGKTTDTSGNVAALEEQSRLLVSVVQTLTNRVVDLEHEIKYLQKEVDDLKSDVSGLSK